MSNTIVELLILYYYKTYNKYKSYFNLINICNLMKTNINSYLFIEIYH